jgi:hypothetical protein
MPIEITAIPSFWQSTDANKETNLHIEIRNNNNVKQIKIIFKTKHLAQSKG